MNLGYCGLDRDRIPLRGDEIRPCWEATNEALDPDLAGLSELVVLPLEPPTTPSGIFADLDR